MIHYGTYRSAVVGLRGAVVGVRGAAVGVRGAAVGNIGIPTYVISRGAVVRQPLIHLIEDTLRVIVLPSFLKSDAQKSNYGSNEPHNWDAGNSHVDMFCTLNALN